MNENLLPLQAELRAQEEILLDSLKKKLGNKKLRIMFTLLATVAGGIEKSVLEVLKHIDRRVFEPEILTYYGGKWESLFSKYCPVHKQEKAEELVEKEGFDIVQINNVPDLYFLASKCVLVEVVYGLGPIFLRQADKTALSRLLFCDERAKTFLLPLVYIEPHKVEILNNPVNVNTAIALGQLREKLKTKKKIVGWVGRISTEKNVDLFLESAEMLGNKYSYIIIGEGWRVGLNIDLINKLKKLKVKVDYIPDVSTDLLSSYIADMDLLCFTSHTEGQPLAMLEAMTVKTPCVSTNVGGISSVIDDGKTGFLVNYFTPEKYVAGIKRAIERGNHVVDRAYANMIMNHNAIDYTRKLEIIYLEEYLARHTGYVKR